MGFWPADSRKRRRWAAGSEDALRDGRGGALVAADVVGGAVLGRAGDGGVADRANWSQTWHCRVVYFLLVTATGMSVLLARSASRFWMVEESRHTGSALAATQSPRWRRGSRGPQHHHWRLERLRVRQRLLGGVVQGALEELQVGRRRACVPNDETVQ